VRTIYSICAALLFCGFLTGVARAETYELEGGESLTGEVVSFNESGVIFRFVDGKYSDRVPWTKFSQSDLKKLAQNPKIAPLVEPFIEVSQEERVKKTEVDIRPVPRMERPPSKSLLAAMMSSSVGWFLLVLLYAANLYAAYEVSLFRAQPRALVCGLAAVPLLGVLAGLRLSQGETTRSTSSLPTTQVFKRGAFTFNRRFFETKFANFFALIRRDADKDMVLLVKTPRGEYVAQRISRIAANDLHLQVQKGNASEEVAVSFNEIQEIQLKHKDA
jgi:hypothetical protein